MSELPLLPDKPAWSVSELSAAIKGALEKGFGDVRVRGELGRVTKAASGHMYFDLNGAHRVIHCRYRIQKIERMIFLLN